MEWRFEGGEIPGRKLEIAEPILLGLNDVTNGSILPKGWKVDPADVANAVREERDET